MNCANEAIELKNEINLFRKKLDSLLTDKNSSPERILEISQELDNLIVKYYRLRAKKRDTVK